MLPSGLGEPPKEALHYLRSIAEDTRALVREALVEASAEGRPEDVLAAIERVGIGLGAAYEDQLAHQRRVDPDFERRLAGAECRKGCSFCCLLKVTVTILEVLRIAARQPSERRSAILAAAETSGPEDRGHLTRSMPCPLLVDGACSIYEFRPLTCRALLSQSAAACERQFVLDAGTDAPLLVPSLATPRLLAASFINGQVAALRDLNLASHPVELVSGLAALEREPALLVRWLNGEDVFPRP